MTIDEQLNEKFEFVAKLLREPSLLSDEEKQIKEDDTPLIKAIKRGFKPKSKDQQTQTDLSIKDIEKLEGKNKIKTYSYIPYDSDQFKDDSWEIEEYTRQQQEREKEHMRNDDYFESEASSSRQTTITSQQVINQQAQRIRDLEAQLTKLQLESEQQTQILQSPKK